jgi:alkanesulfonate monooxygenase SsuD/methylene tetrahydromethanopterin reductase-like flavin-dependent oxidoreductase (luciferase family)
MHDLTFGLKASQQHASMDQLRQAWTIADQGGFDSCWAFDHFVPMGRDRTGDIFEAWTLLAAMAQLTHRVRLGTLVTGNTNRHPGILAKMAVTVDHLSAGRLIMGLGAGGDEYADTMLGLPNYPARERIERLAEACRILKLLWTEGAVTFTGEHYQLEQAVSDPKPVQRPHPPIWIGSGGERYGLRVVAEHADTWVTAVLPGDMGDLGELTRLSRVLDRHCEDVGRDPASIRRAVQFPLPAGDEETIRAVESYVRAGFCDILLMPLGGGLHRVEAAAALLPKLRTLG